jgi:hypothetical protein
MTNIGGVNRPGFVLDFIPQLTSEVESVVRRNLLQFLHFRNGGSALIRPGSRDI